MPSKNTSSITTLKNEMGQSFIEFILLLTIMLGMSLVLLKGVNGRVGERWIGLIERITAPTTSSIELN